MKVANYASSEALKKPSKRSLAMLASIIGRRHGIEVVFSDKVQTAATDGKKIFLPLISDVGNDGHIALIEGLLDHEAMHCRFTDFSVKLGAYGPVVATLTNLFEDVRGEREQALIYPGCVRNIRKSMQVMIDLGLYKGPGADVTNEPAASSLVNWLINGLLARWYRLDALQAFADQHRILVEGVLGKELVDGIWALACKVDGLSSTQDAQKLALSIVELLAKKANERSYQGQREQDKQAVYQSGSSAASGSLSQAIESILSATEDQLSVGDMGSRICAALAADNRAGSSAEDPELANKMSRRGNDVIKELTRSEGVTTCPVQDAALSASRPIEVRLGNRLEDVLQARTDSLVFHKRSGRKLSARRTPGIALGKLDVFRTEEEGLELDTAVSILFDASGSMLNDFDGHTTQVADQTRLASALAVTLAASSALQKHSIPFEVSSFGEYFIRMKLFGESARTMRSRHLTQCLGGTETGCAVAKATAGLLNRPESRKVLVVITDGEPDNPSSSAAMINECRMLGVEIALVFIGNDGIDFEDLLYKLGFKVSRARGASNLAKQFFEAVQSCF